MQIKIPLRERNIDPLLIQNPINQHIDPKLKIQ